MNDFVKNITGMGGMTDQMIATDFLFSAKDAVRNLAFAVTETATPDLKAALRAQLRTAIDTHETITAYMMSRGYYHPYNLGEQLGVDVTASSTALNLSDEKQ
ncbi:spore coat protein [Bacillus sp. T33-2]|uniref:spore coat protein n=1 Tax=Bacillus sp. T33-2 TaxID=2054168 RepID=UPI000C77CC56|nr:spore coat protein [Bacillus sp. T33-2]PLR98750.1 spore coat protein [Bacillus sp. T33-2]